MAKNSTYGWILIALVVWTGVAGAVISAPLAGSWLVDAFGGFSTEKQPQPLDEYTAKTWRYQTRAAIAGTSLTVDACYVIINGVETSEVTLNAGYIESKTAVRQGDQIQMQIEESGYYPVVIGFTVPKLGPLVGGETSYSLGTADMWPTAHADATLSATYAGTDIDAANWDISAGTTYSGVTFTLNLDTANFENTAMGPEKYTEIVGDKDTFSKFIKVDCNDSDIVIKDVKLEGQPLKLIWTTSADGSDYQAVYEYSQMLINDDRVAGDGIYELSMTITCADADNTIAVSFHVGRTDSTLGVDFENALVGAVGSADESVTVTTE